MYIFYVQHTTGQCKSTWFSPFSLYQIKRGSSCAWLCYNFCIWIMIHVLTWKHSTLLAVFNIKQLKLYFLQINLPVCNMSLKTASSTKWHVEASAWRMCVIAMSPLKDGGLQVRWDEHNEGDAKCVVVMVMVMVVVVVDGCAEVGWYQISIVQKWIKTHMSSKYQINSAWKHIKTHTNLKPLEATRRITILEKK